MNTLKRVFSQSKGPRPKKLYCRYPGCGQPFYTADKIQEFCSPACLQDFNYRPPSYCIWWSDVWTVQEPEPPQRAQWWRRKRNVSGPSPMQQFALPVQPTPKDSKHQRRGHRNGHSADNNSTRAHVGQSGQRADPSSSASQSAQAHAKRAAELASKPLPPPPTSDTGASTATSQLGRHHDSHSQGENHHLHDQGRYRHRAAASPDARGNLSAKDPQAVAAHAEQRSSDMVLTQQYCGVDELGLPVAVPMWMDRAIARRLGPPPTPPPTGPLPPIPQSLAGPRRGPMIRRGPRPRSNSLGGFRLPAER
ncbi:hypothetical protein BD414DRAFT_278035 [Trametes punicea]|nr:hypothetical protein BD414DRAFT_278035 [Trametes punicea]